MDHKLSVIILSWNSERDVNDCITSLLEATRNIETEIIVVDNGSTDGTIGLLEQFGERIKLHRLHAATYSEQVQSSKARLQCGSFQFLLQLQR